MKRFFSLYLVLFLTSAALASTGANYRSSPEGMLMSGGGAAGTSYSSLTAGGDLSGISSGSAYAASSGFAACSVTYAATEAGVPYISDLRFDGRAIVSGECVNSNVTITAVVTTSAGSIDTAASSIEIDAQLFSFDQPGVSTFDAATGNLVYHKSTPFPDGLYTLKITARNTLGNAYSGTIDFRVDSKGIKVEDGKVLSDPNPFNPNAGSLGIAYRLNADANIAVFLFSSAGQRIWKKDFPAGSEGGHAGYNFILWNGKSDFGEMVGNDIYFCRVVAEGKVIGKGKIAVIK